MNEWFLPVERYRLTILKTKIAYFRFPDFFSRQETQGCGDERLGSCVSVVIKPYQKDYKRHH